MKKVMILLFALAITACRDAQTGPKFYLNHLYFVLDSVTFDHLFDNNILLSMGDTSIKTTTTTNNSWSGKYLLGKQSYFEFFSSSSFKQVPEQGYGFGFMTHKSGDIIQIKDTWKNHNKDSIQTDTTIIPQKNGKLLPWFYSISLYTEDTLQVVSTWLMENTPDEFKSVGFTADEIKQPISWQQYSEKRWHKTFSKPFNHISAVDIVTNKKEYDYLKKSFLGFGLKDDGKRFYNDDVTINCTVADIPSTKLKSATIVLDTALPSNKIAISNNLTIDVEGKTAVFTFNY